MATPPGVLRAFVHGMMAPGAGEWIAGAKHRGAMVMLLFFAAMIWGGWALVETLLAVMDIALEAMGAGEQGNAGGSSLQVVHLGGAFLTLLALWLWGMASAVDVTAQRRRALGMKAAPHPGWGVFMSWLAPGAGQIALGERRLGWILLCLYFIATPAIVTTFAGLEALLGQVWEDPSRYAENPASVQALVKEVGLQVSMSPARLLQSLAKGAAIAMYCAVAIRCSATVPAADPHWSDTPMARALGYFVLGYVCPGAGQLLQGRNAWGWRLFGAYYGATGMLAIGFNMGLLSADTASSLSLVPTLVMVAAMLDAPIRTFTRHDIACAKLATRETTPPPPPATPPSMAPVNSDARTARVPVNTELVGESFRFPEDWNDEGAYPATSGEDAPRLSQLASTRKKG